MKSFAELFKRYRLRAEFETFSSFSDALSEKGFYYEESIFSHWQKGTRIPTNRELLFTLITIFKERNAITTIDEANEFLSSVGLGYLTDNERKNLNFTTITAAHFHVPPQIACFIGRERVLQTTVENLTKKYTVYLVGQSGIGKTVLACNIGHNLRRIYRDGILWFQVNNSDISQILNTIAEIYGRDTNNIQDLEIKASIIRSILASKKVLLILDNVENTSQLHTLLQNSSSCHVLVTTKYKDIIPPFSFIQHLQPFQDKEVLLFYRKILGKSYVEKKESLLIKISQTVSNLPLAIAILANDLYLNKQETVENLMKKLVKYGVNLEHLAYDNKDLRKAIDLSFNTLPEESKNLLLSLGVFLGQDFSLGAVAYLNHYSSDKTEAILQQLSNRCLVELSDKYRFRLHPTVLAYIKEKSSDDNTTEVAMMYFTTQLNKLNKNSQDKFIRADFDNICDLFRQCYKYKYFQVMFESWNYLAPYLWYKGHWIIYKEFALMLYKTSKAIGNDSQRMKCCIQDLGWCCFWQSDLEDAEIYTKEGFSIALEQKNYDWIAFAQLRLGKIYQAKRLYKESNDYLKKSLLFFEKAGMHEKIGDTLTYMGENYWMQNDIISAQMYLNNALILVTEINDKPQKAIILSHLAGIELHKSNYKKSVEYFKNSIKIPKQLKRNTGGLFWNNLGLGLVEEELGNSEKAKVFFRIAKEEMRKLGISTSIFHTSVFSVALKDKLTKSKFNM